MELTRKIFTFVGTAALTVFGAILMLVSPQVEEAFVASNMFFSGILFIASAVCIAYNANLQRRYAHSHVVIKKS